MAHFLLFWAQNYLSFTRVAVKVLLEPCIYPRLQGLRCALVRCRGTNNLEARNLSLCRILNAGN
jgi:hypothetical protein